MMPPEWKPWLLILLVLNASKVQTVKPTRWPMYQNKPLLFAWNAPTEDCTTYYGVQLQLNQFQIVASPNEGVINQTLTIFYKDRLGLYPYYDSNSNPVNGGLPQSASLSEHLNEMAKDIAAYIPNTTAKGLTVIDWEEWNPLWIRNWGAKDIYRNQSRSQVEMKNPTWDLNQVNKVAQQEFELSARIFMVETLRQAKALRPNQLWGYYLFPDCYNHDYLQSLENYTGRCPDPEQARNDQMMWLWTESTALFPSIYIGSALLSSPFTRLFVRNRVKEAMRIASLANGLANPVYVYTRPTYINNLTVLTQDDLVATIGESVALGAAGIVFWGNGTYANNSDICTSLANYVQGPLGQYLLNVSTAAEECSRSVCGSYGRCLRKNANSDSYLHLNPRSYSIVSQGNVLTVKGSMAQSDLQLMKRYFTCQCFNGYIGNNCEFLNPFFEKGRGHKLQALWGFALLIPLLTFLT